MMIPHVIMRPAFAKLDVPWEWGDQENAAPQPQYACLTTHAHMLSLPQFPHLHARFLLGLQPLSLWC